RRSIPEVCKSKSCGTPTLDSETSGRQQQSPIFTSVVPTSRVRKCDLPNLRGKQLVCRTNLTILPRPCLKRPRTFKPFVCNVLVNFTAFARKKLFLSSP